MCVTQPVASFVAELIPAESAHVKLGWQPECHHAILLYEVHGHLAIRTACHNHLCASAMEHCTSVLFACLLVWTDVLYWQQSLHMM